MVTMKIAQNLDAWEQLPVERREQIIGRRLDDGSRLDLPAGTATDTEPPTVPGGPLPLDAHVAKAGPGGDTRDRVKIFRRGVPFVDVAPNGAVTAGLLFVSFQSSLAQFATIHDEWMNNEAFPAAGTGADALFRSGMATVQNTGVFFVPAQDGPYPGIGFFHPQPDHDPCTGRITIHKSVVDASGKIIHAERGGFSFQLLGPDGNPVGKPFVTDSAGRATSEAVPQGVTYTLRETSPRSDVPAAADQVVTLNGPRLLVPVTNTTQTSNPGYQS
jgi:hypothetical protein